MGPTLWVLPALCLLLGVGCGQAARDLTAPPDQAGGQRAATRATGELDQRGWTRLPASPLSPREGPAVAYVSGEVVVVGGYGGPPCPPGASCAYPEDALRQDGAALDLGTRTWHRIAEAPRPVPQLPPTAVIDQRLYVLVEEALLVWDGAEDSWDQIALPRTARWSGLVADDTRLVLASGSDEHGARPDHVLDTATGGWSTLPDDPLGPSFDRSVTSTSAGLVLTAKRIRSDGGPADPALVHAALLADGGATWRVLPVSGQLGGWRWSWTGHRLVDPTLGGADGGETNGYGRVIPYGGRLDPAAGAWSPLPNAPRAGTGGWPVEALDGPLVAAEGWFYDDADGSWTRVPRPDGAPATPGTAVWADDVLVVHGGVDWDAGWDADRDAAGKPVVRAPDDVWSTGVWAYGAG